MTCIRPAGRRGACSCGNQYAQILDRLDGGEDMTYEDIVAMLTDVTGESSHI